MHHLSREGGSSLCKKWRHPVTADEPSGCNIVKIHKPSVRNKSRLFWDVCNSLCVFFNLLPDCVSAVLLSLFSNRAATKWTHELRGSMATFVTSGKHEMQYFRASARVEASWPIAKSITNVINLWLAMWNPCKTLQNGLRDHFGWTDFFSLIFWLTGKSPQAQWKTPSFSRSFMNVKKSSTLGLGVDFVGVSGSSKRSAGQVLERWCVMQNRNR